MRMHRIIGYNAHHTERVLQAGRDRSSKEQPAPGEPADAIAVCTYKSTLVLVGERLELVGWRKICRPSWAEHCLPPKIIILHVASKYTHADTM